MERAKFSSVGDWGSNTIPTEELCKRHKKTKMFIQKQTGKLFCFKCELIRKAEREEENQERVNKEEAKIERLKKLDWINRYSLVNSELKKATFDNYQLKTVKHKEVLEKVKERARDYYNGSKNNLVLKGDIGTGKSHLAYSLAKALNETTEKTTVFINVVDLFSRLKSTFNNNSDLSESDYIEKLIEADFLIIDDLGLEKKTDWSNAILYQIFDKRERTIITTNFSGSELAEMYTPQTMSRIMKGVTPEWIILFDGMEDYRQDLYMF